MAQKFGECPIINQTFIVWGKSSFWSEQFSSVFLCFSMTTINRQTLNDSGVLRQDYEIIRGLPIDHRLCGPCINAISGYNFMRALTRNYENDLLRQP